MSEVALIQKELAELTAECEQLAARILGTPHPQQEYLVAVGVWQEKQRRIRQLRDRASKLLQSDEIDETEPGETDAAPAKNVSLKSRPRSWGGSRR